MVSLKNILDKPPSKKETGEEIEKYLIDDKINELPEGKLRYYRDKLINYAASLFGLPDERGYNLSERDLLTFKTKVYNMLFPNNNDPCYSH